MANNKSTNQVIAGVKVDVPNGQQPLAVGAGVPVVATGSTLAKTAAVSGQVAGTSVIIRNPA